MSQAPLKVSVVGHTNTGKTSLMRTLMRDTEFGEVSDRPAVTRFVEAAVLRINGEPAIELFDTPGLEDSIGLLESLDRLRGERRIDGIDVVQEFLASDDARERFSQEAKAIRQLLLSDVALYVIDARDRVLGKHRDELEILGRCARPIVPVLNFTASDDARTSTWREHLSRVNMHATAEFDTVVYSDRDEQRLLEKMMTLLDSHRETLGNLIEERRLQRRALVASSATLLAELLVDVAAWELTVPESKPAERDDAIRTMQQAIRDREQRCIDQLLALHRFRPGDVEEDELPIEGGAWGLDLFSPEALKQFGIRTGGTAAAGAAVGLTLDVMLGGLSLGTGTLAGAAIGGLIGAARTHGRRLVNLSRGRTELRCAEPTLRLLAIRQSALIRALFNRGHASVDAIRLDHGGSDVALSSLPRPALELLNRARVNPQWSTLTDGGRHAAATGLARQETVRQLSAILRESLSGTKANRDGLD